MGRALLFRYVQALFNAREWDEALRLARDVRAGGAAVRGFSEIEAMLAEQEGDLETAQNLYLQLSDNDEEALDDRAEYALRSCLNNGF